ncbi:MAG: hypothetical protein LBB61_04085 [Treponema sp.]|nr:hypothetical protein [Treponema sp.]
MIRIAFLFTVHPYDDSAGKGDSSIALLRETLQNEEGEEETAWTLSGKVTTKYQDGYAGVVLVPGGKTLTRLQSGAETIKLRMSGDGIALMLTRKM